MITVYLNSAGEARIVPEPCVCASVSCSVTGDALRGHSPQSIGSCKQNPKPTDSMQVTPSLLTTASLLFLKRTRTVLTHTHTQRLDTDVHTQLPQHSLEKKKTLLIYFFLFFYLLESVVREEERDRRRERERSQELMAILLS